MSILSNFEVESKNLSQESEIPSKEFEIQIQSKLQFNAFREKRCKALTGLTLDNLKLLPLYLKIDPPVKMSKLNCVGVYMMKLKLDLSTLALGSFYSEPSEYLS